MMNFHGTTEGMPGNTEDIVKWLRWQMTCGEFVMLCVCVSALCAIRVGSADFAAGQVALALVASVAWFTHDTTQGFYFKFVDDYTTGSWLTTLPFLVLSVVALCVQVAWRRSLPSSERCLISS